MQRSHTTARRLVAPLLAASLILAGCGTAAPNTAGGAPSRSQSPAAPGPSPTPASVGAAASDVASVDSQIGGLDDELNQAGASMNASETDPTQ